MATVSVFPPSTESKPVPTLPHEFLREANDRGIAALEKLAFLAEILGSGGGDQLNLSPDARSGLAAMLGDIAGAVDDVTGVVNSCRR